jgi:hypothetical protein
VSRPPGQHNTCLLQARNIPNGSLAYLNGFWGVVTHHGTGRHFDRWETSGTIALESQEELWVPYSRLSVRRLPQTSNP